MNTRTLIAAASLTIFAGAAVAEGEGHVDFTNMYSSASRAEVMAETQAFNNMHTGATFRSSEAYGRVDPQTAMTNTTRAAVMAEAIDFRIDNTSSSYVMTNETYNGIPAVAAFRSEGE